MIGPLYNWRNLADGPEPGWTAPVPLNSARPVRTNSNANPSSSPPLVLCTNENPTMADLDVHKGAGALE